MNLCCFIDFGELEITVKRDEDTECWRIPGVAPTILFTNQYVMILFCLVGC